MKYIQYLSVIGILFSLFSHQVLAADVTVIDIIDTNTLNFSLSEGVELKQGTVNGEIQVLQDIVIDEVAPDISNPKGIILSLATPLQTETEYSILTVFGADGTMDFTTPTSIVPGKEIVNQALLQSEQAIEKITLVDDSTLKLQYSSDILDVDNLEYKVLGTLAIKSIEKKDSEGNRVYIHFASQLYPSQDYILMVISLLDINGAEINIDNGIYDFTTPDVLESFDTVNPKNDSQDILLETLTGEQPEKSDNTAAKLSIQEKIAAKNALKNTSESSDTVENTQDISLDTQVQEEILDTDLGEVELNAAGDEEKFVETLMNEVTENPETGAETWILFFLTFIITGFYYSTRKNTIG